MILDPLPIYPFGDVRAEVTLPGSKSITNRALLLAALCKKPVTLHGALFSEDTEIMAQALNSLGFEVKRDEAAGMMKVADQGNGFLSDSKVELFVGNAGTAARFLTAFCAAAPRGVYELDGVPQMHRRPMKGLIDALRMLGADIRCLRDDGFFPIEIHANGLSGGEVEIDASESSQMLSALLMVMSRATEASRIRRIKTVREPFVNMTISMMRQFGFNSVSRTEGNTIWTIPSDVSRGSLAQSGGSYSIEADASSASYFLALPVVTRGKVILPNLPYPSPDEEANLQGDGPKFMQVIRNLGAEICAHENRRKRSLVATIFGWLASPPLVSTRGSSASAKTQPVYGTTVSYSNPSRSKGLTQEFTEFSDTFLTLAAITPLLISAKTKITGIAHTRKQETDRIRAMATELKKVIGEENVEETTDSLQITPLKIASLRKRMRDLDEPLVIETYNDHRIAMSFAILGCFDLRKNGAPWLSIKNPNCCAKTFPNFFEVLEKVRRESHPFE